VTIFTRNPDDGLVRDDVNPLAEKVLGGRCEATKKFDGSACLFYAGSLWKRRMVRVEKPEGEGEIVQIMTLPTDDTLGTKTESVRPINLPADFLAASDVIWKDDGTGRIPGWVPVGDGPEDQWHREALPDAKLEDGVTYELCGPKVQGNAYGFDTHKLIRHGTHKLMNVPTDFEDLREYLTEFEIEGIVWYYDGEPYAKIKRRDFGIEWPVKEDE